MMALKDVLKRPIITEKSIQETALGKYTFEVDRRATKLEITRAVREFLRVQPVSVRIVNIKGRTKWTRGYRKKIKTRDWKKAIITLKRGEKIDLFETGE
jgi:large subunit ribosomal protein L23